MALGVAVTLVFMWLALRDVNFREVASAVARANWALLIALSVPFYALLVWLRALRWKHLIAPIQVMDTGPVVRATAVGFMTNNVFPLRMGEVVRPWYLARETGVSATALFGTVILERVLDTVAVVAMVFLVLGVWGAGGEAELRRGALLLVPVAAIPVVGLVLLKLAPERVLSVALFCLRPFPVRISELVERTLRHFTEGLGALTGGRHLLWISVYTVLITLVVPVVPVWAAFLSLGLQLGSPFQVLGAAWTTQAAIGVAVALPSAPGFFGIFHWACKLALVRFGVAPGTAVAAGTLIHTVMWLTLTGMGLAVLRARRTPLEEVDRAAGPPTS